MKNELDQPAMRLLRRTSLVHEAKAHTDGPGKTMERLYQMLSALDTKASSLLRLDALVITGITLVVQAAPSSQPAHATSPELLLMTVIALVCVTISSAFCFPVIHVSWAFMKHVDHGELAPWPPGCGVEGGNAWKAEPERRSQDAWKAAMPELKMLSTAVCRRTTYYRLAWGFAIFGGLLALPVVFGTVLPP